MRPSSLLDELQEYSEKFAQTIQQLQIMGELGDAEVSPRELVLKRNKLSLYHYQPSENKQQKVNTPVLITYALVNRPSILDLHPRHSSIAKMLECGLDVYLIDWGYPDASDQSTGLEEYVNQQMHACVEYICGHHKIDKINLMGVCQGGVLSLCYSSLHPQHVKNLLTLVTPVDFHTDDDLLSRWVKYLDINLLVDTLGNIPGGMLSNTFLSLKPYQLHLKKYLDLIHAAETNDTYQDRLATFISMEQWIFKGPDQAGEAFRQYVTSCYQQNQLIHGELKIAGQSVDLHKLSDIPVLNIFAREDHIVPLASSRALKKCLGEGDYQELGMSGGHIGIFVSARSINIMFPQISAWLSERD